MTTRVVALVAPAFDGFGVAPRSAAAMAAEGGPTLSIVHDTAALRGALATADVLVLSPRYGEALREVWPALQRVRWIHSLGAGVEHLPFDLLRGSDIIVTNARGVYADALAEFVIGAMFWFAKDFRLLVENQAARKWDPAQVRRLEGATAGIIGYGSIGEAIGRRAASLGMRLLTARRRGGTAIDELIAASDYVVLSTPLTSETTHLMDAERVASMRSTAVLINVARGAIVDEGALIQALAEKRIRGAALDVFETEPLPPDNPLWSLDNVLISPHSADRTRDSHERAVAFFRDNLERFERGEPLQNIVDKQLGY